MYHEMNKIINLQTFSYRSQIYSFLQENNEHILRDVGIAARSFKSNYAAIGKHLKKRLPTDKWKKKHRELHNEGINLFYKMMGLVNQAHQHIFFKCNLIYLAENSLTLFEEIPNTSENKLDNNFALLVKSIETFDSTDRSGLLLFNRLRNVLCHTSVKQNLNIFNEQFLDELIDLCNTLDVLLGYVGQKFANPIGDILDRNIEAYFDECEYRINPKFEEKKNEKELG